MTIPDRASPFGLEWLLALGLGLGAGGALFATTIEAARQGGSLTVALLVAQQALGVFIGAHLCGRGAAPAPLRRAAGGAAAAFLASCLLAAGHGHPLAAPLAVLLVGCGVGAAVAMVDSSAALRASHLTRGSAVLSVAFFASVGAALAPLLAQLSVGAGAGLYGPTAIAFGLTAVGAACVPSSRIAPVTDNSVTDGSTRLPLLTLAAPLLFGIVDNGVLALAPARFVADGADDWTAALIGVAAAGGAAIVQLAAVMRIESRPGRRAERVLQSSTIATIACLALLAVGPGPKVAAGLLFLLGVAIDLVYGAALVACLAHRPVGAVAKAASLFVATCALGEVIGPLLVAGAGQVGGPGLALWAPVLATAGLGAAMIAPSGELKPSMAPVHG